MPLAFPIITGNRSVAGRAAWAAPRGHPATEWGSAVCITGCFRAGKKRR